MTRASSDKQDKIDNNAMILRLNSINHFYSNEQILHDININIHQGEVVACIGPSGGGKSTLLRLCAGLIKVQAGSYHNGFTNMALVFQDDRLLPWKNAKDNIAFALKAKGVNKNKRYQIVTQLAQEIGLTTDDLNKYPADLSGGMRQRVAFARAFAINAPIMLLDEPFSALDIGLKKQLQQKLIAEVSNKNTAVLLITHDLMEAVQLSHRILLLSTGGRLISQYQLNKPLNLRNDDYVYHTTSELISEPIIQKVFEFKTNSHHK